MKRKNQVCVLFEQVPPGTHYREGAYSWVNEDVAEEYIEEGYGKEYDPGHAEIPTMGNTKKEIEAYLDRRGIDYVESDTKAELLELI